MPARRQYNWDYWFSNGDITLHQGIHYRTSQSSFIQVIRNAAYHRGFKVSVTDLGNRVTITITHRPIQRGSPDSEQIVSREPATAEKVPAETGDRGPGVGLHADGGRGLGPTDRDIGREAIAIIEAITRKVAAGEDDPLLRWSRGGRRVRVLFNRAFPDRAVRGPLLYRTLEARLKAAGWCWAFNAAVHTYERYEMAEEGQVEDGRE
jgi:hypothetical protein